MSQKRRLTEEQRLIISLRTALKNLLTHVPQTENANTLLAISEAQKVLRSKLSAGTERTDP